VGDLATVVPAGIRVFARTGSTSAAADSNRSATRAWRRSRA